MLPKTEQGKGRTGILFLVLSVLCCLFFIADLLFGSVRIPFDELLAVLQGKGEGVHHEIIVNFRLPKALAALLVGAALSVSGLLMQTMFHNPLAGPDVLGVSSGAGLGVAVFVLFSSLFPAFVYYSGWGLVFAAMTGGALVFLLVLGASFKVRQSVSLLLIGIMFGSVAGALVSILQNYSNPDALKLFVVWTFGSLSAVGWDYLKVMSLFTFTGLSLSFLLQKQLNALLLGENYARALGISITRTRLLIIIATTLLAGASTAFTGPIAFIGVAVPHIARGLFRSAEHRIVLPASILCGASLLLLCDIVSQASVYTIPINAVCALFGAPLIIWIILKKK